MAVVYYVTCGHCAKRFYVHEDLYVQIQEGKRSYLICPFCKKRFLPDKA